MKASRRKKISCLLLIGLMFIGLLSFKNIYAEGETETPVTTGEVTTGEADKTEGETVADDPITGGNLSFVSTTLPDGIKSQLSVDIYKIADIGWDGSAAKYTFTGVDDATTAILNGKDFNGMTKEDNASELSAFINSAVPIIIQKPDTYKSVTNPYSIETSKVTPDGLYIAITRLTADSEKSLGEYIKSENGSYYSVVKTNGNEIRFTPNLVFMVGEDLPITLKYSPNTSLIIEKNLTSYAGNPVTFVFRIEGKKATEETYHDIDYVSITFKEGGKLSSDPIENIPVDTEVRVTEVYSGASYKLTSDPEQTWTITLTQENKVSFTNANENDDKHGYGAKNTFEKNNTGWVFKNKDVPDYQGD